MLIWGVPVDGGSQGFRNGGKKSTFGEKEISSASAGPKGVDWSHRPPPPGGGGDFRKASPSIPSWGGGSELKRRHHKAVPAVTGSAPWVAAALTRGAAVFLCPFFDGFFAILAGQSATWEGVGTNLGLSNARKVGGNAWDQNIEYSGSSYCVIKQV